MGRNKDTGEKNTKIWSPGKRLGRTSTAFRAGRVGTASRWARPAPVMREAPSLGPC